MNIVGKLVETSADLEAMRIIRNGGREFMTEHKEEISFDEQQAWWLLKKTVSPKDFIARIYITRSVGGISGVGAGVSGAFYPTVGYGLLSRREDDKLYISLAVHEGARLRGIGSYIYEDMAKCVTEDVYAVVLASNKASRCAAEKAGYLQIEQNDGRVLLVNYKDCIDCEPEGE